MFLSLVVWLGSSLVGFTGSAPVAAASAESSPCQRPSLIGFDAYDTGLGRPEQGDSQRRLYPATHKSFCCNVLQVAAGPETLDRLPVTSFANANLRDSCQPFGLSAGNYYGIGEAGSVARMPCLV